MPWAGPVAPWFNHRRRSLLTLSPAGRLGNTLRLQHHAVPGCSRSHRLEQRRCRLSSLTLRYVVGVDYGTLSGRAVIVRVADGAAMGTAVHPYPHAVMERSVRGVALPPSWALQDPADYLEVLQVAVPGALQASGVDPAAVIGISIDFTACTVLPTLADGTPLCFLPEYAARPHAFVKLWKHHAAQGHADRINATAEQRGESWLGRYGGRISSEWEFAKGLQLLEEDPEIYAATERWIEATDWVTWQLCGVGDPQRLHRRLQGHLPGRLLPDAGVPRRAQPGLRRLCRQARAPAVAARRTGRRPDRAGGRLDRSARGHRRRGGQRRRARHRARGQVDRRRRDARRHGHVHLPRHELRRAGRGARHVRRRRRRHHARVLRVRGRPVRRSATSLPGGSTSASRRPTSSRHRAAACPCTTC